LQDQPLGLAGITRQTVPDPRSGMRPIIARRQELTGLIVRVLRASVEPGRVGHFNALIRQQLPILREQKGLVYVKLARRLEIDGGEEVILFE
jgi:hypothetical protein